MNNYVFLADFLAKFASLTSYVQVIIIVSIMGTILGCYYFIKQLFISIVELPIKLSCSKIQQKEGTSKALSDYFLKELC